MEAVVKKATQKTSLEKQIQSEAENPDINTNSFTKCKRPVQHDFLWTNYFLAHLLPLQILNIEANMDNDDEIHDIFIFWHQKK